MPTLFSFSLSSAVPAPLTLRFAFFVTGMPREAPLMIRPQLFLPALMAAFGPAAGGPPARTGMAARVPEARHSSPFAPRHVTRIVLTCTSAASAAVVNHRASVSSPV